MTPSHSGDGTSRCPHCGSPNVVDNRTLREKADDLVEIAEDREGKEKFDRAEAYKNAAAELKELING